MASRRACSGGAAAAAVQYLAGSARILALLGRLHGMGGAELYAGNTAAMWASLAPWSRVTSGAAPGLLAVDIPAQRATRVMLRQPLATRGAQIGALMRRAANLA